MKSASKMSTTAGMGGGLQIFGHSELSQENNNATCTCYISPGSFNQLCMPTENAILVYMYVHRD